MYGQINKKYNGFIFGKLWFLQTSPFLSQRSINIPDDIQALVALIIERKYFVENPKTQEVIDKHDEITAYVFDSHEDIY